MRSSPGWKHENFRARRCRGDCGWRRCGSRSDPGSGAAARGIGVQIVRNGSRGMVWLEPLVEVETPAGRIAYGPVDRADVTWIVRSRFSRRRGSSLAHRQAGRASFPEAADAARFRALRHHRSAVAGRLPRSRRLQGPGARHCHWPGRNRGGGRCLRACAGRGGAGFPDRHQMAHRCANRGPAEIHRLQRRRGR